MRRVLVPVVAAMAILCAGCATAERPSGKGEGGSAPPAVKPYE